MPAGRRRPAPSARAFFKGLKNPWLIGDNVALTQTSGWVDAWTSTPSAYAVAARNAADVAAAVNFARTHRLRLVVKGGGHSYQGTSNAPDSLLVWTRAMNRIELHDAFVGQGCSDRPQPAVVARAPAWCGCTPTTPSRQGRPLRAGRRLHHGGRGRPDPERRLRHLLQALRPGGGRPDRGRGGDGRRHGAHRQRLHQPGPVLGA